MSVSCSYSQGWKRWEWEGVSLNYTVQSPTSVAVEFFCSKTFVFSFYDQFTNWELLVNLVWRFTKDSFLFGGELMFRWSPGLDSVKGCGGELLWIARGHHCCQRSDGPVPLELRPCVHSPDAPIAGTTPVSERCQLFCRRCPVWRKK